jgi:iron complex outermembrane receptor protein
MVYGASILLGSTFNLDAVDRVEVIRGPGSALYGRNAFSGVVNIITKKAINNNLEIGGSYGSFNTFDAKIAGSHKSDNLNIRFDAKYKVTDRTDSKYNNGQGGKDIWNIFHDNLYFNTNAQYKNFTFNGSYSKRIDGAAQGGGDFLSNSHNVFNIGTYNLTYRNDFASNTGISVKFYGRNEYRLQDIEQVNPNTSDTIPNTNISYNQIYRSGAYAEPVFDAYTYGAETDLKLQLTKNNQLLVGIQAEFRGIKNAKVRSNYSLANNAPLTYYDEDSVLHYYTKDNMPLYENGWIQNNGHDYQNIALYAQDVHYFLPNLSATIGGRLDFDSEVGFVANPRIAVVWELNRIISLKQLLGMAYRAPTTNEQYKIMGFDLGNEDLKDERITTLESVIGLKFENLYLQTSIYINWLDNLILQLYTDSTQTVRSYYNSGQNMSYGLELEAKYFINKSIYTFGNYSYTKSEDSRISDDITTSNPHANVANHIYNIGINTKLSSKINWSVLLRYVGRIEKFALDNKTESKEYVSQDRVGDYYLLNSTILVRDIFTGFDVSLQG